jgi:hypothetical protein
MISFKIKKADYNSSKGMLIIQNLLENWGRAITAIATTLRNLSQIRGERLHL